jgi:phosphoglycolate phosphatase-like HAD superfamily hydrolase
MKLAVFDLDGTLLQTGDVDRRCYVQSIAEVFGIRGASTDCRDYTHVTDSGITREVVERHQGRSPTEEELTRVVDRFLELLKVECAGSRSAFEPVPGAMELVRRLVMDTDWQVAIATGGWRASAEFKLTCAEFPRDGIPIATADDAISREEIVQRAIDRAAERYGGNGFTRVVSIGDGVWDVQTARNLDLPFVGIGSHETLTSIGTEWGAGDFLDHVGFVKMLESATVPSTEGSSE